MRNPFRSERLLFRAIKDTPEDGAFVHSVQADPEAYALSNVTLLRPETTRSSADWKSRLAEKCLLAVIICIAPPLSSPQETPVPIGIISLTSPQPGHEHHRNSNISIDIIAAHQRQGYGSEAITWVLNWGFQVAGLHRIGIECFSYNTSAARLYERLGFAPEGRKREAIWFDGAWHDNLSFSMLEGEWRDKERKAGRAV
ncbi:GNAT family protein [Neofusicoccum parvum]|uniref:GNAT family protein n=1 Tax=Neofusicoccum parvum TaxID=310453 RepID=A0ACB5SQ16_9PEZI|nr:GNAT family protein [Neofusicoccum parvum]GME52261.1 GNAT family protein [Neofusicoccum parvum]